MSDIIDINVNETIEEVTINVVDNLITVNINKVTGGGGGTQTLAQTLVLGNITGGENISISNGDAIVLDNGSMLKKGTIDAGNGGSKGISQICGVGYEHKWEAGRLYIMNDGGTIIREVSHNFTTTPTVNDDDTKGFVIDSRWILDNGDVYLCTDDTTGDAVWELVNIGTFPTLQNILDNNRDLVDGNNFQGTTAGLAATGNNINAFGTNAALNNSGNSLNALGNTSGNNNSGINVNAFGYFAGNGNTFDYVNLLGQNAAADENGQTVLSKDGTIMARISTTDLTDTRKYNLPDASGTLALTSDIPAAGVTSVGLTMPSAFSVTNSPITSSGDIAVTGAGSVSQYVRGDGSLANFPASTGGGASLSFYLNGSVSQGTIGGVAFREMDRTPILGAGTDFTINANGYIQSFITDAGVPNLLEIPAGNWNFETYFSASSGGGSPSFYVELYKWNGTTLSLIASNSATPEGITNGTAIDAYFSALAVPQTTLLATDRLAIRIYVTHSGRTITLHTEDNHLCQVITTFSTGLTALNGLTQQVQNLAVGTSGTDFAISSATATHTFNLPTASATNRGALSSTDWSAFNGKFTLPALTSGSVLFSNGSTIAQDNANLFWDNTNNRLGIGTTAPIASLETFSNTINVAAAFSCYSNTATDESLFYFRRGRGTLASPLGVNSGDVLGSLRFAAQFTNVIGSFTTSAKIDATASQNHSVANNGTNLSFYNTANFSNSILERMRIFNGGNVLIQNGGTFTDAGFRLDVNGTTRLNGNTSIGGSTAGARLDVRAQGALSTDIAFRVRNSADSANLMSVNGAGGVEINSTTQGFLPPRMTTTQKNAIASPAAGLVVYDSTLGKLCVRTASAWETITSV